MNEFEIGTYIKKRRLELGMSQEKLCEGLCSVPNLSRIENNQQDPSRSLARQLLDRLGLPNDRFLALWSKRDISAGALVREIRADLIRYRQSVQEDRAQIKEMIQEKLGKLEEMMDPGDRITRQFFLSNQAILGGSEGAYSAKEKLAMQMEAIRLTCPEFNPEDFRRGHYSMDESTLINQIANTYAEAGQRKRAIDIYSQLLWYIEKHDKELTGYANHFCLVALNYAIELDLEKHYSEAIEIAEEGRKVCLKYVDYQFLPGFLAVQAECHYFLGAVEKSRELYLQAYYTYTAYGDISNQKNIRQEMKEHLGIEMPI